MDTNIVRYKLNSSYEFDYNSLGKESILEIENNEKILYIQELYNTPIFNIGQGDKTIEEQIEYLLNKGIIDKEQNELE